MIKDSEKITRLIQWITRRPIGECIILQRQLLTNWDTIKRAVERELKRREDEKEN